GRTGCVQVQVQHNSRRIFFFQAEDGIRDKLVTGVQTCALPISITLDERQLDAKVRAMRAHRTQMNPHNPINRLSPDATRAWLGTERFVRAYPPGAPRDGGEHDVFAGVRLDG